MFQRAVFCVFVNRLSHQHRLRSTLLRLCLHFQFFNTGVKARVAELLKALAVTVVENI